MYCYQKDLPSTSSTSGRRMNWSRLSEMDWFQEGKASTEEYKPCSSLEWIQWRMNMVWETPRDLTEPRIAPFKNTWKPLQIRILAQFEARSRERLSCSRSPQHTARSLHWESGVHEDTGWALPEGVLNSESIASCVKSNSQYGLQDPQNKEATLSWEPSSDSKRYGENFLAPPWIKEFLEYFLQSGRRIQYAGTESRGWSRSSRTSRIKIR